MKPGPEERKKKDNLNKPEGRFVKSSNSKLLKKITLNYKPKISLNKGLSLMIGWHKKNFS